MLRGLLSKNMSNHDSDKPADPSSLRDEAGGTGAPQAGTDAAAIARLERSMTHVLWRLELITTRLGIATTKAVAPAVVQPPPLAGPLLAPAHLPQTTLPPTPLPLTTLPPPLPPIVPARQPEFENRPEVPAAGPAVWSGGSGVDAAGEYSPHKRKAFTSLYGNQPAAGDAVTGEGDRGETRAARADTVPAAVSDAGTEPRSTTHRWVAPPEFPTVPEPTVSSAPFDWERLIGGKAFAALGAAAVCIGAVLFLKLAISEGWFSGISPALRCVLTGLAGFALLGSGELIRRRYGAAVSTGISTAGIGISYASVLAAWGWYSIVGDGVAFSLLAFVGGIGVVVAVVSRQPIIAVVGLLGAYMAPVFLYQSSGSILVMPVYLTVLLCAGQIISLKLRGWFSLSGTLAWWGTLILGGLWCMSKVSTNAEVVLSFIGVVYAVMQVFALLRAERRQADMELVGGADNSAVSGWDLDTLTISGLEALFSRGLAPIASFSVAGWCALLGVAAARQLEPSLDWTATAVMTIASVALCGAAAMRSGRGSPLEELSFFTRFIASIHRVLLTSGGRLAPVAALAFSFLLQGASLLLVTVALAASDDAAVFVWLAMAVGAIAAGRKLHSVLLDGYGLLLLGIALMRLLDGPVAVAGEADPSSIELLGLHLGLWNVKALLAAMACVTIGRLLLIGSVAETRHIIARIVAGIGVIVTLLVPLHPETSTASLFAAWAGLLLAATQLNAVDHRLRLPRLVGGLAVPLSVMALGFYAMFEPKWTWLPGLAVIHQAMLAIACYTMVLAQCRWLVHRAPWAQPMPGPISRPLLKIMGYTAVVIMFVATTLEAARVTHMVSSQRSAAGSGISIYWSVLAVACIAVGLTLPAAIAGAGKFGTQARGFIGFVLAKSRRGAMDDAAMARAGSMAKLLRRIGLGLLMVTLLKVVIIDLASVGGLWRVASFLATGGLMIGVAMAYARLEKAVTPAK